MAPGHPLTDEQTLRDLYLPLGLLGLGVAVQLGATLISNWHAPQEALRQLGVNLIGGTVVMLVGVMIGLRLRQIQIGSFWVAVLKVAALAVAPTAGAELLGPILGLIPYLGGLAEFALVLVLYFTLIGALFDLDDSDTWYVMCVLIVVRLAVGFGAMALLGRWE